MIEIKPKINHSIKCPSCKVKLASEEIIFQGIHIVAKHECKKCNTIYYSDLPVGHAMDYPYIVDLGENKLWGSETSAKNWFGKPLMNSLLEPKDEEVEIEIKKYKKPDNIVILNCLDYLYGHSLLKLLNADRLIKNKNNVVIIIPKILEWMVPEGVAEVWIVNLSLKNSLDYYRKLNEKIKKQLKRFKKVYVDKAYSHPSDFVIEKFTGVRKYNFKNKKFRISFIWRADRPWVGNDYLVYGLKKLKVLKPLNYLQYLKVILLFSLLKRKIPEAKCTVVGPVGKSFTFPDWIDDQRVDKLNAKVEKNLCQIYSESRIVIGVHGSNMLLPSAHAGMIVDLLPVTRMGNFAQDVLYQENSTDSRMISFKYRYLPISTNIFNVCRNAISMIKDYDKMLSIFEVD